MPQSLLDEMKSILAEHTGFIKSMWCGDLACEEKVKEETGMPSRCMPFEQEHIADTCPVCGKPANKMVVLGRISVLSEVSEPKNCTSKKSLISG